MAASAKQRDRFRPLYGRGTWAPRLQDHGNVGLWYDKYADQWTRGEKGKGGRREREHLLKLEKTDWILKVTDAKDPWRREHVEETIQRQARMAVALGGRVLRLQSTSRFVTGLGREHPVENGFSFHPTLGTPYLPGSGVKGVLRAWMRECTDPAGATDDEWFGAPDRAGIFVVLDLLPVTLPQLVCDIVTPHYGPYYDPGGQGVAVPGDWHDPVPSPYLAVESGTTWQTAVLPRPGCERGVELLNAAESAVVEAFRWLGAGAKTAVGYGRFELDKKATEKIQKDFEEKETARRERRAFDERTRHLSPAAREFERSAAGEEWETSKDAFARGGGIEGWLDRMEEAPEHHVILRLEELVRRHFPGLLENPDLTKGKRQKPVFSERQRGLAGRLQALRERLEPSEP